MSDSLACVSVSVQVDAVFESSNDSSTAAAATGCKDSPPLQSPKQAVSKSRTASTATSGRQSVNSQSSESTVPLDENVDLGNGIDLDSIDVISLD